MNIKIFAGQFWAHKVAENGNIESILLDMSVAEDVAKLKFEAFHKTNTSARAGTDYFELVEGSNGESPHAIITQVRPANAAPSPAPVAAVDASDSLPLTPSTQQQDAETGRQANEQAEAERQEKAAAARQEQAEADERARKAEEGERKAAQNAAQNTAQNTAQASTDETAAPVGQDAGKETTADKSF